ncbi:MAG TPA: NAD-dependent protein deacetylase [Accumulibacter sp.]|uniref:NAD-dependent protein deacetylase n=1 Tax=Accumulibacter sp. TaxID=2053492 RepID=UPI002BD21EA5|nr:NAD-dependent protein deacetylase [Accumulibacter sp.]HRD89095.1 NAD-dependent protein deacetylase [Accumulibacter sp.]
MNSLDAAVTDDRSTAVQPSVDSDRESIPGSTLTGGALADVGPGADLHVDPGRPMRAPATPAASVTRGFADTGMEPGGQVIGRLAARLRGVPVVVLSGAGLSTASGIPAYRDRHGRWQQPTPIQHRDFLTSPLVRQRYWARSFFGWPRMGLASPATGHRILSAMEQRGIVSTVVTQNVDGLHQKASSRRVIELHGGIGRVLCLACGQHFARAAVQQWLLSANPEAAAAADLPAPDGDAQVAHPVVSAFRVPACPGCGGMLKPDVVFFGDSVPRDRLAAATQAIDAAQALLVVGSSLMVYSGFRLADYAHRQGKPVLAINRGVTRADHLLELKIDGDCGAVLELLALAMQRPA